MAMVAGCIFFGNSMMRVLLRKCIFPFLSVLATSTAWSSLESMEQKDSPENEAYLQANEEEWECVFFDSLTGNWEEEWFLDGEIGSVKTSSSGMEMRAGPEAFNDSHHVVLWTYQEFEGDLKIEYEYTRLDEQQRFVNILYIQATGSNQGPYKKDIAEWSDLRSVPSMRMYFDHMNTYHLSYAANFDEDETSYIRGRRYMPHKTGLDGTKLEPDYYPEGLFQTGITHKICVIKKDRALFVRIENPEQVYYCHIRNTDLPGIDSGRVGLRHMFTRSARYKNFRVSVPENR